MELDAILLSRLQFALILGFHILFPTLTLGLAPFLVLLEGLWLRTGREIYVRLCVACSPLGLVAVVAGWVVTEVGPSPGWCRA